MDTKAAGVAPSRKRGRPESTAAGNTPAKKAKLSVIVPTHADKTGGVVLALGQGDTGQLGLGEDIMERSKPAFVKSIEDDIVDICAGGMHSVALSKAGEVTTQKSSLVSAVGWLISVRGRGHSEIISPTIPKLTGESKQLGWKKFRELKRSKNRHF